MTSRKSPSVTMMIPDSESSRDDASEVMTGSGMGHKIP